MNSLPPDLAAMLEAWLAEPAPGTLPAALHPHMHGLLHHALGAKPAGATPAGQPHEHAVTPAELARLLDGAASADERASLQQLLALSPTGLADALSAALLVDEIGSHIIAAPDDLLAPPAPSLGAQIIPLRRPAPIRPPLFNPPLFNKAAYSAPETFMLLAAATADQNNGALLCKSQSGLWTLEIFAPVARDEQAAGNAMLLLNVDADHRQTYEGREACIYVELDGQMHVLANAPVLQGEVFAEISVAGLDLAGRDAVNVIFGPAPVSGPGPAA